MNKKVKKILNIIVVVSILILLDFAQTKLLGGKPIFSVEKEVPYGSVHMSLLADAYSCKTSSGEEEIYVTSKNSKYSCAAGEIKKEIEIINENTTCDKDLNFYYEDDYNKYYLKCISEDNIFIILQNNLKLPLKEALEKELVTINELEKEGLNFYRQSKIK